MQAAEKQIESLFEKARERHLTPMWTHFHRKNKKGTDKTLAVTTCVLLDETGNVVSRGAAVVGKGDCPSKVEGRRRSIRRAFRAAAASPEQYEKMLKDEVKPDPWTGEDVDRRFVPTKKTEGLSRYVPKFARTPAIDELSEVELSRILAWTKRKTDKKLSETV